MKTNKKLALAIASFGCALTCMVGSTYAWYVVSNTASASVSAQTASASKGLDLGVANKTSKFDVKTDATFVNQGTTLDLNNNVKANGYATAGLVPVTTGKYQGTEAVTLKSAPTAEKPGLANEDTSKVNYIKFTLVFSGEVEGAGIYLNASQTTFTDASDTHRSVLNTIRVGFESTLGNSIMAPSFADADEHETNVGGVMDLNGDGVWDYNYDATEDKYTEIFYGQGTHDTETILAENNNAGNPNTKAPATTSNSNFIGEDVKHLGFANDLYAKDVDIITNVEAETQVANGLYYYEYDSSEDANNHPICSLDTEIGDLYYGTVDVTVWVEGWDAGCVQSLMAGKNFGFTFGFNAPELIMA